ncbi:hypothetical protein TYRP_001585 [Tyrophagus putrescentiae]|nr:hypothetical protein TYRP_001585 [Tyrophagus putrescentiae]
MESSSSGRFQVVFVMFLMLLSVSLAIDQKESNDICKKKDKPGFQLNLTGAMIFSDHIFMMDNKSQVYKVPKSNYDGAYGKMTMNIKGIPIEEYWPPFKGNKD